MKGIKHDKGKVRFDLLPYDALWEIAEVFTKGAEKYGDRNWELGIHYERVFAALMRHLARWWMGEDQDKEFMLHSLAHAGACVLFLLHYELNKEIYKEFDNRPIRRKNGR